MEIEGLHFTSLKVKELDKLIDASLASLSLQIFDSIKSKKEVNIHIFGFRQINNSD